MLRVQDINNYKRLIFLQVGGTKDFKDIYLLDFGVYAS